ncbi:MAG: LysM peptidoglycan-binding domain-containing protein [Williamsia sp.]|nr:LysM peptidoglycan-binding domain-containing protein [Williamsia sp.]
MYKIISILVLSLITGTLLAQPADLVVQGVSPDMYLTHIVAPKENWYSVGRMYNISPKEIAPFNKVAMDKPLAIGEQIKIPLTNANFSQDGNKGGDEVLVPVYHTVQDKEWMFRISTNYNKVPIETLEKWNHVSKDQAKAGMKLIIGYLKVKKDLSAFAGNAAAPPKTVSTDAAPPPVAKADEKKTVTELPKTAPPKEDKEPVKTLPAEDKPVVAEPPVTTPVVRTAAGGEGFFKSVYENGGRRAAGTAGIFKSKSGWDDKKYYALMNDAAIGTIVKVTNPATNKIVYAKILGQLPDMKESIGLTLRLSDAAAAELGASDNKFQVVVN